MEPHNPDDHPQLKSPAGRLLLSGPLGEEQHPAAYGMARIVQFGQGVAGIFLNVRADGVNVIDFELGVDLIVFDSLEQLDPARAIRLKRNEEIPHPRTGEPVVLVTYPGNIGFVPLGYCGEDGVHHPHAGTGFCLGRDIAFPADLSVRRHQDIADPYQCLSLQQYRYNGEQFEVVESCRLDDGDLFPGWDQWGAGMSPAIIDGDDLLMAFYGAAPGSPADTAAPFISRWSRRDGKWQVAAISPVPDAVGCREPSLIRDSDGSLLLSARHGWPPSEDAPPRLIVWRSEDGENWTRQVDVVGLRSGGPLCIGKAANGRPVIAGNGTNQDRHSRASVSLWTLNATRDDVESEAVVFDPDVLFGPAPIYAWNADHAIPALIQLANGPPLCLTPIRLCETTEVVKDTLPTPVTGCHVLWF